MALACVLRGLIGPMGASEQAARLQRPIVDSELESSGRSHWLTKLSCNISCCVCAANQLRDGDRSFWPISLAAFAKAYAMAEGFCATDPCHCFRCYWNACRACGYFSRCGCEKDFVRGAGVFGAGSDLLGPVAVLLAAWLLGGVISDLGAADALSVLLKGDCLCQLLPLTIFAVGSLISFSTGTSWGTMGVLMPLAIPVVFQLAGEAPDAERDRLIVAAIGAVFSGAVFGDHCSQFSDTTIVASIAAGVEPMDHVRTQLPFALLTAPFCLFLDFLWVGAFQLGFACWLVL